jgi:hypothetical protein
MVEPDESQGESTPAEESNPQQEVIKKDQNRSISGKQSEPEVARRHSL